jgi:D-inositol-3-phosphate glycosyltransferase
MRVLTVARWYPSHDGPGRGTFVADLVRATAAAGVDARVVSFDRVLVRGRLEAREAVLVGARAAYERVASPEALFVVPASRGAPGVPVARLPVVRRPGATDGPANVDDHLAALRPFVTRLLEGWPPDVIHAHTGLPDGVAAATVGRELGIPVAVTEHASTIEAELADPAAVELYRTLLEPGARLLAVSPPVAGRLASLLGAAAGSIGVLPNPVDDAAFLPADPAGRDADELLWVGALGEHKGIDVLLRAVARLRSGRPGVHLRLVGGERAAGDMARWRGLANELGIGDAVVLDGWLDRPAVAAAMARAGAFVHPSPSETFGVAAAEAILSGLPVATRRSGGVPWLVELSGGFGAVADGDDPAAFAGAIETVLDRRLSITAEAARARLVEQIGAAAVTARALEAYRDLAAASPGGTRGLEGRPAATSRLPATTSAALPSVLVATEREQSIPRVAALPDGLRAQVTLVVPPPAEGAPASTRSPSPTVGAIRIVEASPARHERPPKGRGPIARLKRATWKPPPTADEELAAAVSRAIEAPRSGDGLQDVVALDAPAAVLVSGMDARRVRLASGTLRWLADRWDAEEGGGR